MPQIVLKLISIYKCSSFIAQYTATFTKFEPRHPSFIAYCDFEYFLSSVAEKRMTLVDNVNELKKMFVGIGLEDVKSTGLDFFDLNHAKLITEYVYTT